MNKPPSPFPITAFIEGDTEDGVIKGLVARQVIPANLVTVGNAKGGKEEKQAAFKLKLSKWFAEPLEKREPLSLLVMRDQDQKGPAQVVQSVQEQLRPHLPKAELASHSVAEGVYQLDAPSQKLRLALMIARWEGIKAFFPAISNHAMDDYVLTLAMQRLTAQRLLAARHKSRQVLGVDKLLAKVKDEIPALLVQNGLAPFIYAKDHIRFYAALLGTPLSPVKFAEMVMQHADEDDLRSHFASLLAAVAFLSPATT